MNEIFVKSESDSCIMVLYGCWWWKLQLEQMRRKWEINGVLMIRRKKMDYEIRVVLWFDWLNQSMMFRKVNCDVGNFGGLLLIVIVYGCVFVGSRSF